MVTFSTVEKPALSHEHVSLSLFSLITNLSKFLLIKTILFYRKKKEYLMAIKQL